MKRERRREGGRERDTIRRPKNTEEQGEEDRHQKREREGGR